MVILYVFFIFVFCGNVCNELFLYFSNVKIGRIRNEGLDKLENDGLG